MWPSCCSTITSNIASNVPSLNADNPMQSAMPTAIATAVMSDLRLCRHRFRQATVSSIRSRFQRLEREDVVGEMHVEIEALERDAGVLAGLVVGNELHRHRRDAPVDRPDVAVG